MVAVLSLLALAFMVNTGNDITIVGVVDGIIVIVVLVVVILVVVVNFASHLIAIGIDV